MPAEDKKWGIGIEHEFRVTTDDSKSFRATSSLSRYPTFMTNIERWVDNESDVRTGEKIVADVHEDPTVTPGYEVATRGFQQDTVEKSIKKLRAFEKAIVNRTPTPPNHRKAVFPYGIATTSSGKMHNEIRDGYDSNGPGSYHVSITFPHDENSTSYKEDMHKFLSNLQWLEPLIFAVTGGPSPDSIDDAGNHPEGSVRTTRSEYHNAGGINPHDRRLTSEAGFGKYLRDGTVYPKYLETIRVRSPRKDMSKGDFMNRGVGGRMTQPGIEVRILDSFDSQGINPVIKFLLYTAAQSKNGELSPIAKNNSTWQDAMKDVMEEGHNVLLSKDYINKLKEHLNLETLDADGDRRASEVMRIVEKELWQKNKNSEIAQKMIQNNSTPPKIYNFNRDAWDFLFKLKLRTSHNYKEGMDKFMKQVAEKENMTLAEFNDIVLHIFGPAMVSEDTSDIADMSEINGLLKVNRKQDGTIDKIRSLYTSTEAVDKCTALAKDAGFSERVASSYGIDDVPYPHRITLDTPSETASTPSQPSNFLRGVRGSNFVFRLGDRVTLRRDATLQGPITQYQNGAIGTINSLHSLSNLARVEFGPNAIFDVSYNQIQPYESVRATPTPTPSRVRRPRPQTVVAPSAGVTDNHQWARRFAQLKAIVNGFLRASSTTQEERNTLNWITTTSGSSRDPNIRQLYERALAQYTSARQQRAERTGRRISSSRSFGREGRMYQKSYGPGWFVKSKEGDIRRKEIVRHKIAAIKGARKRKLRKR